MERAPASGASTSPAPPAGEVSAPLEALVDVEASGVRACSPRVLDALFAQCMDPEGNTKAIEYWFKHVDPGYLSSLAPREAETGAASAEADEPPPSLPFRIKRVSA